MKSLLLAVVLTVAGTSADGDEGWGPYIHQSPVMVQQTPVIQNFQLVQNYYGSPSPMVPVATQYLPVTTYQNILVEHKVWCFHKRYEIVRVPQTVYVPVKY